MFNIFVYLHKKVCSWTLLGHICPTRHVKKAGWDVYVPGLPAKLKDILMKSKRNMTPGALRSKPM